MAEDKAKKSDTDKLLKTAKERFKLASEAEANQREREKDDLSFQIPENQWDDGTRTQRQGDAGAGIPPRPILSVSKLDQPIQLVLNQERAAHLGVQISPVSADAEPETAEVLEGLYRRIERDSNAHVPRSWAFERAVKCGRGRYRIVTEYDESTEDPFDQVIRIKRILHQDAVYWDPSAQESDFSDANWCFIASWVPTLAPRGPNTPRPDAEFA